MYTKNNNKCKCKCKCRECKVRKGYRVLIPNKESTSVRSLPFVLNFKVR